MKSVQPNATESTDASDTVQSLIEYCRENVRVCPMPQRWTALWDLLPNRTRIGTVWQPPTPLILAAWHDTPGALKMSRVAEHIEWAAKHGELEPVARFLRSLPENDWLHLGE